MDLHLCVWVVKAFGYGEVLGHHRAGCRSICTHHHDIVSNADIFGVGCLAPLQGVIYWDEVPDNTWLVCY